MANEADGSGWTGARRLPGRPANRRSGSGDGLGAEAPRCRRTPTPKLPYRFAGLNRDEWRGWRDISCRPEGPGRHERRVPTTQ